jgi:hypothetical protein
MLVPSVFFCLLLGTAPGAASTLLHIDVATLSRDAEAVVAAEALSRQTERMPGGALRTRVLMLVDRVIAGTAPAKLELSFLGGELGDVRESVSGFDIPRVGEKAIYFVASLSQPMVVPLLGWDQGRFLLRYDTGGVERVFTAQGLPVVSLDASRKARGLSAGVADGVVTAPASQSERALSLDDFAAAVRATRDHAHAR